MKSPYALLCPGQGSQRVGMGRQLAERFPEAGRILERADRALGFGLSSLCFQGPEEELTRTENAQPALLAVGMAYYAVLSQTAGSPAVAAGHSLGEYTALCAAGALELAEALRLVRRRGELMARAACQRPGAMAALLGISREQASQICELAGEGGIIVPANFNCPGQVVVSGEVEAVRRAADLAKQEGGKAIPLRVSGAFHSPLMEEAAAEFADELNRVSLREAAFPVVSNVSAEPVRAPDQIRRSLCRQLTSPVQWEDSLRRISHDGARALVELGPGDVLAGLARRTLPEAEVIALEKEWAW